MNLCQIKKLFQIYLANIFILLAEQLLVPLLLKGSINFVDKILSLVENSDGSYVFELIALK